MRKPIRTLAVCAALACAVGSYGLSAGAVNYYADTRLTPQQVYETLPPSCFTAPGVTVNTKTYAVNGLYTLQGVPVHATLSSDLHWFIVPTTKGYLYFATGY